MKHAVPAFAPVLVLCSALTMGSCGLFSSSAPRLATAEDLVTQIERVHIESELAKEKTQVAIDALRFLVNHDYGTYGDAVGTYQNFVKAIEISERQAAILEQTVAAMKESAGPVFSQWQDDLSVYTNETMRQKTQDRLDKTQGRYDALVAAVDPAIEASDAFHAGLQDHALFFGHDFNPTSVATVEDETTSLMSLAGELDVRYDACLAAARAYFETRALPNLAPARSREDAPTREDASPRRGDRYSTAKPPAGS